MFIKFSLVTFLIFSQFSFSKNTKVLETFLFCEDKLNVINDKKCNFQKIPHLRAKRLSRIESKSLNCGKSKIIGIVTERKCLRSKYLGSPPVNARVSPQFIKSNLSMRKMLNKRSHNRDH